MESIDYNYLSADDLCNFNIYIYYIEEHTKIKIQKKKFKFEIKNTKQAWKILPYDRI